MKTNILILKVVLIEIAVIFLLVKLFNSSYFDFDKIMPFEWDGVL